MEMELEWHGYELEQSHEEKKEQSPGKEQGQSHSEKKEQGHGDRDKQGELPSPRPPCVGVCGLACNGACGSSTRGFVKIQTEDDNTIGQDDLMLSTGCLL